MDEPPQEALAGAQSPDNQKTQVEGGTGQAHKGSEDAGVGSSEQANDSASSQAAHAGSGQTEEAERRAFQLFDQRPPGHAERKTSLQVDRKSSDQSERRTSGLVNQQLPSIVEGKASEKIDDRVTLLSGGKASDQGTSEDVIQISSDQAKSQRQIYNQDAYEAENFGEPHRVSENVARDNIREKQADYRSYYKTLAQTENRSLSDADDNQEPKESDHKIPPCTFEDSQADLRSKVSTTEETESATTIQVFNLPDSEFITNSQSYDKLPSITTRTYFSNQDKIQTTEAAPNIATELEQRKNSQRPSLSYKRRLPPIVFEDPYQVALRYMEKHNILQIFQITENLVYEKPDDPLDFMLSQVQEMIRFRDERRSF